MTSMRISELADRAGVPASTLRFYEKSGLLPAGRTASGYRVYDEGALERLAFIKAVKLLGLSLSEVGAVLTVWTAGSCDQVRADLRPRLAERIADAELRQAELGAYITALRRELRRLDTMPDRAAGCDASCGYAELPGPVPVACSLEPGDVAGRLAEWRAVLDGALRADLPGGVRVTVPAARAGAIAALAAAEQRCCPFFGFLLQLDGDVVHLNVRAPADADDVLSALFR